MNPTREAGVRRVCVRRVCVSDGWDVGRRDVDVQLWFGAERRGGSWWFIARRGGAGRGGALGRFGLGLGLGWRWRWGFSLWVWVREVVCGSRFVGGRVVAVVCGRACVGTFLVEEGALVLSLSGLLSRCDVYITTKVRRMSG